MGLSNERIEMLRQVLPEQMERDPSGALADLTLRATKASEGTPALVHYVHADKCAGGLAVAGRAEVEPGRAVMWFAAPRTEFERVPDGWRVVTMEELDLTGDTSAARTLAAIAASGAAVKVMVNDEGAVRVEPAARPGVKVKRKGWEFPNGFLALVDEPPELPAGPASFPVQCARCGHAGEILRVRVADDLRQSADARSRVPVSLEGSR